jgi:hypothetical protein
MRFLRAQLLHAAGFDLPPREGDHELDPAVPLMISQLHQSAQDLDRYDGLAGEPLIDRLAGFRLEFGRHLRLRRWRPSSSDRRLTRRVRDQNAADRRLPLAQVRIVERHVNG